MKTPKSVILTKKDLARFWTKVEILGPDDCWRWSAGASWDGYGKFGKCVQGITITYRAHRIAYISSKGETNLRVCHTCNNRLCCNPAHLFAGTQSENIQQCYDDGRRLSLRGANSGTAKLTEDDVRQIRAMYRNGVRQRELRKIFLISSSNMSYICNNHTWKGTE